jgi:ABC-type phosphate transport system auxiliary subunit
MKKCKLQNAVDIILVQLINYINSIELSYFWETNSCSATRQISSILRNLKIHYRYHKTSLPASILSQMKPVRPLTANFFETRFNIILLSTSRSF